MTWVDDMLTKSSQIFAMMPPKPVVGADWSDAKKCAVLLARRRRFTVTDGRVAASLALYEAALERAK